MAVKRIVVNTSTLDIETSRIFYHDILGLEILMDMGWIRTYGNDNSMQVQMSFMTTGGSGTVVPEISIEVDDVDRVYQQMNKSGFEILPQRARTRHLYHLPNEVSISLKRTTS